jgi:gas vesicle protein
MSDHSGFSGMGVILAFVGGAAAGAVAAMLLAPKSGVETRKDIKHFASEGAERAARIPGAIREAYNRGSELAKDTFSEAYKQGDHSIVKNKV